MWQKKFVEVKSNTDMHRLASRAKLRRSSETPPGTNTDFVFDPEGRISLLRDLPFTRYLNRIDINPKDEPENPNRIFN